MKKQGELTRSVKRRSPGGKVLCTAMAVTILLTQTASAAPWQWHRNELIYDSEIGFFGNVTLTFASDGGSFIRPIKKDTAKASASKVMSRQNMDTHSKVGSLIPEQSRIR